MENVSQGTVRRIIGSQESVNSLVLGETGASMLSRGNIKIHSCQDIGDSSNSHEPQSKETFHIEGTIFVAELVS